MHYNSTEDTFNFLGQNFRSGESDENFARPIVLPDKVSSDKVQPFLDNSLTKKRVSFLKLSISLVLISERLDLSPMNTNLLLIPRSCIFW